MARRVRAPRLFLPPVLLLALGACGTTASEAPPEGPRPLTRGAPEQVVLAERVGVLPPQSLVPGQCGMFLWAGQVRAHLVMFATGYEGLARMVIDGTEVDLDRRSGEGQSFFGHFSRQSYVHQGTEISLNLRMARRADLVGGAVVEQGLMRLREPDGWSHVIPVAGLIACQPQRPQQAEG
jgi:hypothetical protein